MDSCFDESVITNINTLSNSSITVLELFSGTKSFKNCCQQIFPKNNCNVITLDINNTFEPNIEIDIMNLQYTKMFKVGAFDIIWASPECTEYSLAKTTGKRDIVNSNSMVLQTMQIINYLKPKFFFIENPKTGFLKVQAVMKNVPFYDVDYCKYSNFGYKKPTRIWTNVQNFIPKTCDVNNPCDSLVNGKHVTNVQMHSVHLKNRVPINLIYDLLLCTNMIPMGLRLFTPDTYHISTERDTTNENNIPKRGRPRKHHLHEDDNSQKKRGRPRKHPSVNVQNNFTEEHILDDEDTSSTFS